jgi:hypothetical protein
MQISELWSISVGNKIQITTNYKKCQGFDLSKIIEYPTTVATRWCNAYRCARVNPRCCPQSHAIMIILIDRIPFPPPYLLSLFNAQNKNGDLRCAVSFSNRRWVLIHIVSLKFVLQAVTTFLWQFTFKVTSGHSFPPLFP